MGEESSDVGLHGVASQLFYTFIGFSRQKKACPVPVFIKSVWFRGKIGI